MPDEFIPKEILSKVVIINQDSEKYERYRTNLNTNNNENNLQHTFEIVEIKNLGFLSGYIYTDINKVRQNSYIKLILAINNLQTTVIAVDNTSQSILAFNLQGN